MPLHPLLPVIILRENKILIIILLLILLCLGEANSAQNIAARQLALNQQKEKLDLITEEVISTNFLLLFLFSHLYAHLFYFVSLAEQEIAGCRKQQCPADFA